MIDTIFLDMDGTLTTVKSPWQHVHEQLGDGLWEKQGQPLLKSWLSGDIDYTEFCTCDVDGWNQQNASLEQVNQILLAIPVPEKPIDFLKWLADKGVNICIISTGFQIMARAILQRAGLELGPSVRIVANDLTEENGAIKPLLSVFSSPDTDQVKVQYKGKAWWCNAIQEELGVSADQCGAIGDSNADQPMFNSCKYWRLIAGPHELVVEDIDWLNNRIG